MSGDIHSRLVLVLRCYQDALAGQLDIDFDS
ncbi:hypothetical protein Pla175_24360 [Pirellulimonas nuda]|uniref:Uncharacterized protein n=1 Tax=Pirellulimonas nuda TaxID=2528009 RepID=A0A518DC69_9BACT|nr:hypothetical protein Pla175_24360 [Pirellulimonas nuda]